MRIEIGVESAEGPLVDLRDSPLDPEAVLSAIRDPSDERISVETPGPLHDRIGFVRPGMTLALRPALAQAMRTRRKASPLDRDLAIAERTRRGIEVDQVDLEGPRAALAAATADTDALRERVARLGGEVSALRETGAQGVAAAADELEAAVGELAEAETEQVAAEQRLARARVQASKARDREERRLGLDDRIDNLRRDARAHLVAAGWPALREAVRTLPVRVELGEGPETWSGPDWVGALGVSAVADLRAPIVVTGEGPTSAARPELLDIPVIRI